MKIKLTLLTASLFTIVVADQASAANCPKITTDDLKAISEDKKIISDEANFIEAVDHSAAENIRKALHGMGEKEFAPRTASSEKHELFSDICVYEVDSNGIKEAWVKVTNIPCPNITKTQAKQLLEGKDVFPQWRFHEGSLTISKLDNVSESQFHAGVRGGREIPRKKVCQYMVTKSYKNDMSPRGRGETAYAIVGDFSLEFKQ